MNCKNVEKAQNWIKLMKKDSLAKILLKNSHLTEIQLETFLIDMISEQIVDRKLSNLEKSRVRLSEKKISRGSFNRSLQQARRNINRSIWSVLLLGYLGILETPSLSSFIETSNKLENYMREYNSIRNTSKNTFKDKNKLKIQDMVKNNLINTINSLISSKK